MKTSAPETSPSFIGRSLSSISSRFAIGPVWFDVVLFGLSALFATVVAFGSKIPLYRQWGQLAIIPYLIAMVLALGLGVLSKTRSVIRLRLLLSCLVIFGATVVPTACEVTWRFEVQPQSLHVQPEVVVIERAASFLAHGHNPYQAHVVDGHLLGAAPRLPAYESFFPYLPAMVVFGLPASTYLPHRFTDARIFFLLATLLIVALALWKAPGNADRRLRALQVAIALPWAALAIATGGDDIPIVAMLLAAMVLAQRRRPGWSGLVFGLVCAMKFTAWPVALLALFAARDHSGRRRPLIMGAGIAVIVLPLVLSSVWSDAKTFGANVIEFPLGLAGVASPAGSALPGHILVTAFPAIRKEFVAVCVVLGVGALAWYLWRRSPKDAAEVSRVAGWTLLIAILLAPATRIGYLIYPLNLFVWSWMLTPTEHDDGNDLTYLGDSYASSDA